MEESNDVDIEGMGHDPDESQPDLSTIENIEADDTQNNQSITEKAKPAQLPLARIRHIMKMDPDCELINQEAAFLVTKSTELFLKYLSQEAVKFTSNSKRKTVQKKDVDAAIDTIPCLCFLDGTL